jgi:kynurenine formamidase
MTAMLSRADFAQLAIRVDNAGRWGSDDELGTLNFLTEQRRLQAVGLVRTGTMVSCAGQFHPSGVADPGMTSGAGRLTLEFDEGLDWTAVNDRLLLSLHGRGAPTHLDALAHFFYHGTGYNKRPVGDVSPTGVSANAVTSSQAGIAGRGVLIDLPAVRGQALLAPGEAGTMSDVTAALDRAGLAIAQGDIVFIRTGWPTASKSVSAGSAMPGLSIECAEWVHRSELAMIVTDCALDPAPSQVAGVLVPWHILALTRMGLRLVDLANLEALAGMCSRLRRWEFFAAISTIPIAGSTSSPVNPLALF